MAAHLARPGSSGESAASHRSQPPWGCSPALEAIAEEPSFVLWWRPGILPDRFRSPRVRFYMAYQASRRNVFLLGNGKVSSSVR